MKYLFLNLEMDSNILQIYIIAAVIFNTLSLSDLMQNNMHFLQTIYASIFLFVALLIISMQNQDLMTYIERYKRDLSINGMVMHLSNA